MARLFLIIVIALAAYIIWLRFQNLPIAQRRNSLWQVLAIIGGTLLLLLVVTGRLHWLGALAAAAIPLLKRLLPLSLPFLQQHLQRRGQSGTPPPGQQSGVTTGILSMSLDHDSGHIEGVVTSGPFEGQQLAQMCDRDLLALYQYCCQRDSDSAQLLQGYLDQRLGPGWQADAPEQPSSTAAGTMSRGEALAILGLDETANREQITLAHRRLMQKLHPDHGGNDYLAAQLNQARNTLLS